MPCPATYLVPERLCEPIGVYLPLPLTTHTPLLRLFMLIVIVAHL
jgi:hypothetical protein